MKSVIMFYPKTGIDKKGTTMFLPLSILYPLINLKDYKPKIIDQRLDRDWKNTLKRFLKDDPVCIGISAMTGCQIKHALEAAELVKTISPKTLVVWGGVHASLLPEQTLENKNVDIVVNGEAEDAFVELVKVLDKKKSLNSVKGIYYKKGKTIIKTAPKLFIKEPKILPKKIYELVNPKNYLLTWFSSINSLSLLTGRGCPHRCAYCYNHVYNKRTWRPIPAKEIIKGVKTLRNFGAQTIELLDDNFFVDINRVKEFCRLIHKENIKMRFVSNCRIDYISRWDQSFLNMLRKTGFVEFFVGVETGSQRMLDIVKKDTKTKDVIKGAIKLRKSGIHAIYSFMGGMPHETIKDTKKTIDLMLKLNKVHPEASLTSVKIFVPFPGTELYHESIRLGFKPPTELEQWGEYNYNNADVSSWRSDKYNKFIEKISYITYFIDPKFYKFITKNPFIGTLITIYSSIVKLRCKLHFYHFMPEIFIMKTVGKKIFD